MLGVRVRLGDFDRRRQSQPSAPHGRSLL